MIGAVSNLITEPWVLLILLASFAFAAGNFIDELLLTRCEQEVGTLVIISGLFGIVLMAAFAIAARLSGASLALQGGAWWQAIGVGMMEILWLIPYLYAIQRRGALISGPLFQGVPVIALGLEAAFGTIPPTAQISGAALIVAGGILLTVENKDHSRGEGSHRVDWLTIALMSASALIVALSCVLFKDAAEETAGYMAVAFWSGLGMALAAASAWAFCPPYRRAFNAFLGKVKFQALGVQLFNEVVDTAGVYLTHLANVLGPSVMLVMAFNATQPIIIGLIGITLRIFGVRHASTGGAKASLRLIATAILLIAIGVVMIAWRPDGDG